jgi:hypothetical protein
MNGAWCRGHAGIAQAALLELFGRAGVSMPRRTSAGNRIIVRVSCNAPAGPWFSYVERQRRTVQFVQPLDGRKLVSSTLHAAAGSRQGGSRRGRVGRLLPPGSSRPVGGRSAPLLVPRCDSVGLQRGEHRARVGRGRRATARVSSPTCPTVSFIAEREEHDADDHREICVHKYASRASVTRCARWRSPSFARRGSRRLARQLTALRRGREDGPIAPPEIGGAGEPGKRGRCARRL